MKKKFMCLLLLVTAIISGISLGALDSGKVVSASVIDSNSFSNKQIEITLIENNSVIEITGHYTERLYCERITYALSNLFASEKIELKKGYAKYNYDSDLYSALTNVKNDDYLVWNTEQFDLFAKTVADDDLMFWRTDTEYFIDDFGCPYYYIAMEFFEESDGDTSEYTSNRVYDRYGNWTEDGGTTWIMPVQTTNTYAKSTFALSRGNLDIGVERTSTGWRIINKGTLACKVRCVEEDASQATKDLDGNSCTVDSNKYSKTVLVNNVYYDYPPKKSYQLKSTIDLTDVESTTMRIGFEISVSNEKISGREVITDNNKIGFKNADGSKMIAYFGENSGKEAGWYLGEKLSTTAMSKRANYSISTYDGEASSVFEQYIFTKMSSAPTIQAIDEVDSNISQFLLKNSGEIPQSGILTDTSKLLLPLCLLFGIAILSISIVSGKKSQKEFN